MAASNRLDFGLGGGMNVDGLEYPGYGMDRGLPDFPYQFPGGSSVSTGEGIVSSSCTTTDVFTQPLGYGGPVLRPRPPPNSRVDFRELERQRDSREKRSTAMLWTNVSNEIKNLLKEIQSKPHVSPEETKKIMDLLTEKWKELEGLHTKYLSGINERKRLGDVEDRYSNLKRETHNIINECEGLVEKLTSSPGNASTNPVPPDRDAEDDDNASVSSKSSVSSLSSRKKSLKKALVSKLKLDMARARATEDAEASRMAYEHKQRMELRRLEEEASLAELEWKIETEYNDEGGLTPGAASPLDTSAFRVDRRPHSTPVTSKKTVTSGSNANPGATFVNEKETVLQLKPRAEEPITPVSRIPTSRDSVTTQPKPSSSAIESNARETLDSVKSSQSFRVSDFPQSQRPTRIDHTPHDPVAAMWKVQMLSGMQPTRFSGNPVDYPSFRDQIRTHLESDLLTGAQRVEYLPKFVTGEALDVVKRNRGSSFKDIMKTLEERFGRTIRITQACIEDLVSGPKLTYGDNIGLMNFSEKLNTATRILQGDVEREASVATNLRRIVGRLPNDLITKWQNENYEIVNKSGRSPRLKDIATFVKRQASIRNDPVFGGQMLKRENKEPKLPPKPPMRNPTIGATDLETKPPATGPKNCKICKSKSHRLQHCPIIRKCDHVAVRRQYAASYGFCFNCGIERPGHGSTSCPEPPACSKCPGRHLSLLHSDKAQDGRRPNPPNNRESNDEVDKSPVIPRPARAEGVNTGQTASTNPGKPETVPISSAGLSTTETAVLLNVVPVIITAANGNAVSTYAFLDSGCTDTLVDRDLMDHLCMQGTPERIGINTITNSGKVVESSRVSFTLSSLESLRESIEVSEAYVLPDLNQSQRALPEQIDVHNYPHLHDIGFPAVDIKRVSILVGNNIPYAHIQKEVRVPEDDRNGLYGCRYPLGWCVCGPYSVKNPQGVSVNFVSVDRKPADLIERFWKLEDYGAVKSEEKPISVEDKRAMRIIDNTTRLVDGRYEVGMLWKKDERTFPNNLAMARQRLESLRRRLMKPENEDMATKYRDVMDSYINSGFARKLSEKELDMQSSSQWYLPHHPVTSPTKPGKVRIVFDAAAEYEGTSLNKNLLSGPDMTNSLVSVLLRFRQGTVGIAADIEGMFHQIRVREEDQDSLRFLWWTNSYEDPPDVYVMQVHIFGAASSPCVANSTLRRVADDNAEDFSPSSIAAVKRNFYVDDALPSENNEQSAIQLAQDLIDILARGSFNLTKFTSNSKEVLKAVPSNKLSNQGLNLDLDDPPIERALGVLWFVGDDSLGFRIKHLDRPETKRGILSTVCSLFDPLGFAAPVALAARCLIQELWKANVGWDEPLGEAFLEKWRSWKSQLPSLSQLRIPRSYFLQDRDPQDCKLQLHVFSDASEVGYGVSSYLRAEYPDGQVHCAFVIGKARNAPVKFVSIPRLELQAAVLATRVCKMLQEELELNIDRTFLWTDSEIVLHYLKNEKRRLQTFVANRVEEIKQNSLVQNWNHVPGTLNPADYVSRGMAPSSLTADHNWLRGPDFLWGSENSWPKQEHRTVSREDLELKKEAHAHALELTPKPVAAKKEGSQSIDNPAEDPLQALLATCSDWTRLRRKVAWVLRFTQFIKDKEKVQTGRLTVDDLNAATVAIAKIVQSSAYAQEIKDLRSNGVVRASSKIVALNPELDANGVLRVNGRGQKRVTEFTMGRQIILPRNHAVAEKIVRHVHHFIGHLGREHVTAKLREEFWIPQVRVLVRSVVSRCVKCKKVLAKPMIQQMAPLPEARLMAYEPPFSFTGMDLFGPLYVKHGRGTAKRWCCLFTCLTTRCVHLEVVNSMDTDDFIMCLRRFINRRGEVKEIRCDNGSNFVGAERELKESLNKWNQGRIESKLIQHGCKWLFQPPTASSMSGVWERLVRSAKTVLKSILGGHVVADVVLQTLLTEVERVLNGRALTANSDDPSDFEPLTPAHFLMQSKAICLPPGVFDKTDMYKKKWRQVQHLANLFWERWLKEYLPSLQPRAKWRKALPNVKPNALVLLVNDNTPRGHWNLGRVIETYPGPDGLVRTVKVKTKDSVYVRPIQKLCLLENDLESM